MKKPFRTIKILSNTSKGTSVDEGEQRFRSITDALPHNIWISRPDGAVEYCNQHWLDYTGVKSEQLLGWNWTGSLHPEDVERCVEAWIVSLKTGNDFEIEYRWRRGADGTFRWHLGRAIPVKDSRDNIIEWVGTMTDIEAEKQAGIAAEKANRAKSDFLSSLSHELRTPLNSILGYAQIILRDSSLSGQLRANLEVIKTSGEMLLTLINDLLDLAKIEAGKQEIFYTDVSLHCFLAKIEDIIRVKSQQKGLIFNCNTSSDLPIGIQVDENRLRQVLLNLLSNAIKFTDKGSVNLNVLYLQPLRLRFEVEDTGIGISEDHLESIFAPFEQGGEVKRRLGGTGLGLAISQGFVRLMGGEIHVESRMDKGSKFWFELDIAEVNVETPSETIERRVTGYKGKRRCLLIVDDNERNRALLTDMLEPLGFQLHEAENGFDALEKACNQKPDLILMDIIMPHMDGLEATRRLRRIPEQKDVPIIAISASAGGDDRASCLAAGLNVFLAKPIDFDELLTEIARMLKLSWEYESAPALTVGQTVNSEKIIAPPAQAIEVLYQLAREGNMNAIAEEASKIAQNDEHYRSFSNRINKLANGYQSKALLRFIEQYYK